MESKKTKYCGSRIETIIAFADKVPVIADIGCDHGYISRELLERDIAKKVIASDISENSLSKAKNLPIVICSGQKIDFRAGDGLNVLEEDEADAVIIAGMGGKEIIRILSQCLDKAKNIKYFIFCPHKNSGDLRKFLYGNGFNIIDEVLAFDNDRCYENIKAQWNGEEKEISDFDAEISPHLIKNNDSLLKSFLNYKITRLNAVFDNVPNYKKYPDLQKKLYLKNKMEELIKCL